MPALLRIYGECLSRTFGPILKSPWVILLPMAYAMASNVAASLLAPLGIVGGFIMGFIAAGLAASFLYMLDELVSANPVKPAEVVTSVRRYLWPVMNVMFVFWIASMLLGPLLGQLANGTGLYMGLMLVLFVLLNATPEAIYQKGMYGGLDILKESIRFIQENWIEWFVPNLALLAIAWFGFPWLLRMVPDFLGGWGYRLASGLIEGCLVLPVMVFRGHLFRELDTSTSRQRKFRYR
jgi:hypothetical protein